MNLLTYHINRILFKKYPIIPLGVSLFFLIFIVLFPESQTKSISLMLYILVVFLILTLNKKRLVAYLRPIFFCSLYSISCLTSEMKYKLTMAKHKAGNKNDNCNDPSESEITPWIAGITAPPTIAITNTAPAVSVCFFSVTVSKVCA